jgi:hypothetical protein
MTDCELHLNGTLTVTGIGLHNGTGEERDKGEGVARRYVAASEEYGLHIGLTEL